MASDGGAGVLVRLARSDEVEHLRDIERAAGERFREVGMGAVADDEPPPAAQLAEAVRRGHLWVAELTDSTAEQPPVVGYAWGVLVGDQHHLEQVSVMPEASGRGVGRALIDQVATWARSEGAASLTLSTFRDVAWNGPLYEHLGFREVADPDADPRWARLRQEEAAAGLDVSARIIMRLPLDADGGEGAARPELGRVLRERYEVGLAAIDDPDLLDQ